MTKQLETSQRSGSARVVSKGIWKIPGLVMTGISMLAVVSMLFHIVLDVVSRNILNQPIQGTLEYTTYWYMVTLSFIGMWLAQTKREHIAVTLLTERLPALATSIIAAAGTLISVTFLIFLAWFGWQAAVDYAAIQEYVGIDRIPIWPIRFIVPISLLALAVTMAITTVQDIRSHIKPPEIRTEEIVNG